MDGDFRTVGLLCWAGCTSNSSSHSQDLRALSHGGTPSRHFGMRQQQLSYSKASPGGPFW